MSRKKLSKGGGHDLVGGALGHDQVVAGPEPERAVVGLQGALAPVDEVDDVAVGVADEAHGIGADRRDTSTVRSRLDSTTSGSPRGRSGRAG